MQSLGHREDVLPGYGDDRGHWYTRQDWIQTSTITQTTHQAIAEGPLMRPEFLPLKGATCGVNYRLKDIDWRESESTEEDPHPVPDHRSSGIMPQETYAIG